MKEFLLSLPRLGVLADVGCGNGKYFGVKPDLSVLGSDRSTGLALQAMKLCKLPAKKSTCRSANMSLSSDALQHTTASQENEQWNSGKGDAQPSHTAEGRMNGSSGAECRGHFEEECEGQAHVSCMLGRAQMQACAHADVLVADAMQLPYKVRPSFTNP